MKDIVIRIEGLGKQYYIGRKEQSYKTLRETLADGLTAPFRKMGRLLRGVSTGAAGLDEPIWALKGLSLEVRRGEVLGIIGRNGAGKSTLLKLLSRITEPTEGYAEMHGRVASLLEVGIGFHGELTGRENVYLNGAILGMKRTEINRKFDEIVAFAEVDKFIDTPVKHYSSGMYLRLAFAVAAHLESEILIVDEVLAVGDARFQKKCLNKMEDIGQKGRTVLFVSHNMPAVTRLCERAILLDEGRLLRDGPSHQIVKAYLNAGGKDTQAAREWPDPAKAPGGKEVILRAVCVRDENGRIAETVDIRKPVSIEMEYEVLKPGHVLLPHYVFYNEDSELVFMAIDQDNTWRRQPRPKGRYKSSALIPGNFLSEGTLFVTAAMVTLSPDILEFFERDAVAFQVVDSHEGDSARGDWTGNMAGAVRPLLHWNTVYSPNGTGTRAFF